MDAHVEAYLKYICFHTLLKPLIERNYELRKQGKLPDKWYWADRLALSYGYGVK